MSALPLLVWLQGGGASPSPLSTLFPFVLIFLIFYFLLIRPQQKKQRKQEAMIKSIEKGDLVVTAGGLQGKVTGVTDEVLSVEVAAVKGERVRVKVTRARIDSVQKAKGGEDS